MTSDKIVITIEGLSSLFKRIETKQTKEPVATKSTKKKNMVSCAMCQKLFKPINQSQIYCGKTCNHHRWLMNRWSNEDKRLIKRAENIIKKGKSFFPGEIKSDWKSGGGDAADKSLRYYLKRLEEDGFLIKEKKGTKIYFTPVTTSGDKTTYGRDIAVESLMNAITGAPARPITAEKTAIDLLDEKIDAELTI